LLLFFEREIAAKQRQFPFFVFVLRACPQFRATNTLASGNSPYGMGQKGIQHFACLVLPTKRIF
jgi:hypothetical protein